MQGSQRWSGSNPFHARKEGGVGIELGRSLVPGLAE